MNEISDHDEQRVVRLGGPGVGLELVLRPLRSDEDYARGVALQEATWGQGFAELTSATMMLIAQKVGGIAAGAFDPEGELRGYVFGITGWCDRRPTHWSHMLAVDTTLHGRGLGRLLKLYQRDELLAIGVDRMLWTYDPLVSRNAHLNLNRLGAEPIEYHVNLYGDGGKNALHRGLGTDRFVVEWRLDAPEVRQLLSLEPGDGSAGGAQESGEVSSEIPRVNTDDGGIPLAGEFSLPDAPAVRIEVPGDIQQVKEETPDMARRWRECTRRAFLGYMERGHRSRRLLREAGRYSYLMEAPTR